MQSCLRLDLQSCTATAVPNRNNSTKVAFKGIWDNTGVCFVSVSSEIADREMICAGYWQEDMKSYLITYDDEDPMSGVRCWVGQQLHLSAQCICPFHSKSFNQNRGCTDWLSHVIVTRLLKFIECQCLPVVPFKIAQSTDAHRRVEFGIDKLSRWWDGTLP